MLYYNVTVHKQNFDGSIGNRMIQALNVNQFIVSQILQSIDAFNCHVIITGVEDKEDVIQDN